MNEVEKKFLESIENKIKKYEIRNYKTGEPLTVRECLPYARNKFIKAHYNDGSSDELIDVGIESFLYKCSPLLFIEKYGMFELPGLGDISCHRLYYFQREILKDFTRWKKIVLTKTRQCLTEDNYVYTDRGYISIKDVKIGDKIKTIKNGKIYWTNVLDFIPQGKKNICSITTAEGDIIKCTLDHKILTKNGWKEAQELTLKDELVSDYKLGEFGDFKLENDKLAALIGYYLADGKGDQPIFVNTNLNYINECKEAGELFENCYPTIKPRSMEGKLKLQCYDLVFTSYSKNPKLKRPFLEFKKRFGLDKKSVDRVFTEELMNLNQHQMSILINRLFAGDGWCTFKKDKRRPNTIYYEIGIGAPNYRFLKQLEYILKTKYGICCKVQKQKRYDNDFWKLRIQKKADVKLFLDKIGIFGKEEKIAKILEEDKNSNNSYLYKTKIKKIELLENKEEVYDITTETHDFLANNIVVHNCGMSTLTSLIFWWKAINFPGEWLVIISKDGKSSQDFLEKIKYNIKNTPKWMGVEPVKNNAKSLAFSNRTKIDSFARSKTAGRGTSPTMVVLDEAAFYGYLSIIEGIVSSVMPSLARTAGTLFVISTSNGSAEGSEGYWYYKQVMDLQDVGGHDRLSVLYDVRWWEILDIDGITPYKGYNDKVQSYIDRDYFHHPEVKKEANDYFMPIAKDHWQENDWLSFQMNASGKVKYLQEILCNFTVTGNTVFSDEIITEVSKKTKYPIVKDEIQGRPLKGYYEWVPPKLDHNYIITVDVSRGSGDDSSCVQVVDTFTYEQCAEYSGKCTTLDLARYAYWIGEYYNFGYLIVESNSIGEATFSELYYNLNYPNLYKQKKNKNGVEVMTGWNTSPKTRELITSKFIDYYYDKTLWEHYHPYSERLLEQMKYYVWKGGRPDHSGNTHDDNIMAMALALFNIPDAIKNIRKPDDMFFIGEDGSAVTMIEENTKFSREYINNVKGVKEVDENFYRNMEKQMYRQAGINENDPEAANTYRWLIS